MSHVIETLTLRAIAEHKGFYGELRNSKILRNPEIHYHRNIKSPTEIGLEYFKCLVIFDQAKRR